MHDFLSFFLFFATVIFAVNQVEKSIARRTADEIERRSKPPAPPKPKPPGLSLRESLTLVGAVFFLIGFIAVAGKIGLGVNCTLAYCPGIH